MNVLFIMADQLRWDHLGCAGHSYLKTPNIDALARTGTRFTDAYVSCAVCSPSRAALLLGAAASAQPESPTGCRRWACGTTRIRSSSRTRPRCAG